MLEPWISESYGGEEMSTPYHDMKFEELALRCEKYEEQAYIYEKSIISACELVGGCFNAHDLAFRVKSLEAREISRRKEWIDLSAKRIKLVTALEKEIGAGKLAFILKEINDEQL